ncbi:MAG: PAS domain S-box protein [Ignavibacteria bacterium]|jgi:PAS domain S-box-containing protein|nr:PAS domain S-box protein [Ignavibacteria bacterium]MCU7502336.1 PAS domain S-box protein [Ignavibacteria bacterium]MCU7515099.1 PAS domain S-box protein [Ignavibacteria bacterium]
MINKDIKCLLIAPERQKPKLEDRIGKNGTVIDLIPMPEDSGLKNYLSETDYDVCLFFIDQGSPWSDKFTDFISSCHEIPSLFILEDKNCELAFKLMKSGAGDVLFLEEFTDKTLLDSIKRLQGKNILSQSPQEEGLLLVDMLNSLFKSTPLGFAVFNTQGSMLGFNSSFQKILGFSSGKLLSMKLRDICYSDYVNEVYYYDDLINEKIDHFELERPLYNKEGNLIWCRIFVSLIKVKSREPKLMVMTINNTTEKKQSSLQLEKERYYLQRLMDNIPDAIYFKDAEHRFTKVSRYVHLKSIKDSRQAVGKTDFDFFAKEHAQEAFEDEENIIRTGKPIINKVEKETFPNGDIAWVSSTKAPLFDSDGNVNGIVGISRDVTEMKLSEEALLKSEERYRNLVEYIPDTITVICENKIVFVNSSGLSLMKASSMKDLLNKDIFSCIHAHYRSVAEHFMEKILKHESPARANKVKLITLSGETIDAEMTGIPTTYNGKPAIQLVTRDITDLKRQEKIKQTTLKILQASNYASTTDELFRYIHQAIGSLMPVNNFYIALFDEKSQMLSFPYWMDEEDEQMLPKKPGRGLTEYVLRNGKAILLTAKDDLELQKQGEVDLVGSPARIWLGVPLQIKDKTIGVIVVQDYNHEDAYNETDKETLELISFSVSRAIERKKSEEEILNYVQQLKESNTTKDRFFSFISHDLRGPFSSLLGFSEMMLEDFDNLSHQDLKKYLEIINATSKNLYNLLNNLLQFSRFQTGRIQFVPVKCNLGELIAKNIDLLSGNALKKGICLKNEAVIRETAFVDEEMISSAIQNLITNAVKFTPRNGSITVKCTKRDQENEALVSISDTGVGMDKDTLDKLFRIEVIHSTSGTEKEPGTGLGLILTKESIEKNNGKLWVESAPGKGSTFYFTIPLSLPKA